MLNVLGMYPGEAGELGTECAAPDVMNSRWGGFLEGVDRFDAPFFGISRGEASMMDPQQRLLLEVSWEALEDAAIARESIAGRSVAAVMGVSSWNYATISNVVPTRGASGLALCINANRLSYFLNVHGPSLVVDTACSSSLVAADLACRYLASGTAEVALVGGVNVILAPQTSVSFAQAGMLAADGRCKKLDERADGYVRSEGCGVAT